MSGHVFDCCVGKYDKLTTDNLSLETKYSHQVMHGIIFTIKT